jgi:hypothetical protein
MGVAIEHARVAQAVQQMPRADWWVLMQTSMLVVDSMAHPSHKRYTLSQLRQPHDQHLYCTSFPCLFPQI